MNTKFFFFFLFCQFVQKNLIVVLPLPVDPWPLPAGFPARISRHKEQTTRGDVVCTIIENVVSVGQKFAGKLDVMARRLGKLFQTDLELNPLGGLDLESTGERERRKQILLCSTFRKLRRRRHEKQFWFPNLVAADSPLGPDVCPADFRCHYVGCHIPRYSPK